MVIDFITDLFGAQQRLYWPFLLTSCAIAAIYLWQKPKSTAVNLSKKLWLHPSAILDYGYFCVSVPLKLLLIAPFIITVADVSYQIQTQLLLWFGWQQQHTLSYQQVMWLFTIILFVGNDLTRYLLHRYLHKNPYLWRIHQVHHSAKVLTPLTFYRVHPIEHLLFGLRYALTTGLITGFFTFYFGALLSIYDILGVNVLTFLLSGLTANLRHSHVALAYPKFLEYLLISPKQHQIHHSRYHNRKNYGSTLAIWDYLFATLTLSHTVKKIHIGLNDVKIHSITSLLTHPFRRQR